MSKKGQMDMPLIALIVLIFGLMLIAPIILKIFISIKAPISASLGNVTGGGGAIAQSNFNYVLNTGINFWDKVIVAAFFLSILLVIISSLMIDTSIIWVILYIFIFFFLVMFTPDIIHSLDNIYESQQFSEAVTYLGFINAIRTHFGQFLVGMGVLTMIIIYGKIAFFRNAGQAGAQRR